jgi:hypothetical protein
LNKLASGLTTPFVVASHAIDAMALSDDSTTPDGFTEWPVEAQRAWLRDCTSGALADIIRDELAPNAPEGRTRDTITKEQRIAILTTLANS